MPFESIKWYREAELQHGRVAQLAWLGFVFPNIYHLPVDETHNFGELNVRRRPPSVLDTHVHDTNVAL